jgi:cell division septum initiation protein DivIVA
MARLAIAMTVVGCLLLSRQPVLGQQVNKRIELLQKVFDLAKKECELAKKENEMLRKENEQLKKEIEQLKKATDKKDVPGVKADKEEKPSASADGINYVVDKVTRNGTRVTLHMIATNTKADCMILAHQVEAVDTDGNLYNGALARAMGIRLRLREGVKTRFDVVIANVPTSATEFSRVEIHGVTRLGSLGQRMIGSERETVHFRHVRFGK